MELSVGSKVIYGTNGVCLITDYREENFGNGKKMYYILKRVAQKTSEDIFVPEDNNILMGRIKFMLSEKEIYDIINAIPDETVFWIDDNRIRSAEFDRIISDGDRKQLMLLIKSIYEKKKALALEGKKLGISDERSMRTAERILYEEFAEVLNMEKEDVIPFISNRLAAVSQ